MKVVQQPLALALLLAWLPLVSLLIPLPTAENVESVSNGMTELTRNSLKDAKKVLDSADIKHLEDSISFWQDTESVQSLWLRNWAITFFVILLGLVASTMAIANLPGWRLVLLVSALVYLIVLFRFSESYIPNWQNAQRWWLISTQLNNGVLVVYRELIFPIFQSILFVAVFSLTIQKYIRKRKSET